MAKVVYQLFEEQVKKKPENVALIYKGKQYTYQELNTKIDSFLSIFKAKNHQGIIAIILDRSVDMIIAVWAVIKSGNAYLPIDPSLPPARIESMLKNSSVNLVLTNDKYSNYYCNTYETISLDRNRGGLDIKVTSLSLSTKKIDPLNNLAYVMYTSGTTCKPKGVMISHHALSHYVRSMQDVYPLSCGERVLFKTPFNFDVSIREVIWTLSYGGTIVAAEPDGHRDPVYISDLIDEYKISVVQFVPSMLGVFLQHPNAKFSESINCVICSGEAMQLKHVKDFFDEKPHARLLNMYGPTEATVEVSVFDCAHLQDHSSVPIGQAIGNNKLHVLNDDLTLCGLTQTGKLYISGDSLAQGYINNKELTRKKFIIHDFEGLGTLRLYETGDLARNLEDGNVEYLGREDDQLSIHGYRIELDEIKNIIISHGIVDSVYVTVWNSNDVPKIVAYVKAEVIDDKVDIVNSIFNYLKGQLPEYMIPSYIMALDEFPLTANGKVNRDKLPEPAASFNKKYKAPSNDIEKTLQSIWDCNFNIKHQISINDSYFKLGGDSISMINIVKDINSTFKTKYLFQNFISNETIEKQALYISETLQEQLIEDTIYVNDQEEFVL